MAIANLRINSEIHIVLYLAFYYGSQIYLINHLQTINCISFGESQVTTVIKYYHETKGIKA